VAGQQNHTTKVCALIRCLTVSLINPVPCCSSSSPAHGNVAITFYYRRVKSVAPYRLVLGTEST
jgi:hypothetical protein